MGAEYAVTDCPNDRTEYITENGIRHQVIVRSNGTRCWYLNETLHRVRGPAVEWADGDTEWWLDGEPHRDDGPSDEYTDGTPSDWWWNGILLTKEVREQGIDQLSPEEIKFWLPILAAQKTE